VCVSHISTCSHKISRTLHRCCRHRFQFLTWLQFSPYCRSCSYSAGVSVRFRSPCFIVFNCRSSTHIYGHLPLHDIGKAELYSEYVLVHAIFCQKRKLGCGQRNPCINFQKSRNGVFCEIYKGLTVLPKKWHRLFAAQQRMCFWSSTPNSSHWLRFDDVTFKVFSSGEPRLAIRKQCRKSITTSRMVRTEIGTKSSYLRRSLQINYDLDDHIPSMSCIVTHRTILFG